MNRRICLLLISMVLTAGGCGRERFDARLGKEGKEEARRQGDALGKALSGRASGRLLVLAFQEQGVMKFPAQEELLARLRKSLEGGSPAFAEVLRIPVERMLGGGYRFDAGGIAEGLRAFGEGDLVLSLCGAPVGLEERFDHELIVLMDDALQEADLLPLLRTHARRALLRIEGDAVEIHHLDGEIR